MTITFYIIAGISVVINLVLVIKGYQIQKKTQKSGVDPDKHLLPEKFLEGAIIKNDKGQPVFRASKPLQV